MTSTKYIVVTCTVPNEEMARKISMILIEQKLVTCVNIIHDIRSIYTWKGEINDETECMLVMKTRKALFSRLSDAIKEHHSYECPEILALPVIAGNPLYLNWIDENTSSS